MLRDRTSTCDGVSQGRSSLVNSGHRSTAGRGCRMMPPMAHPRAGQPAQPEDLIDVDAVVAAYYDLTPDPTDPDQRVVFGTSGPPRLEPGRRFQRRPHRGDHPGHLRVPRCPGLHRAALPRQGHPCPVRTGVGDGGGGAGGQRRRRSRRLQAVATRRRPRSRTRS